MSSDSSSPARPGAVPKERHQVYKWNGWGHKDSKFVMTPEGQVTFTGQRYGEIAGQMMPNLRKFLEDVLGASVDYQTLSQDAMPTNRIPSSRVNAEFLDDLKKTSDVASSRDDNDRLFRAHGHTLHELFNLRHGALRRVPDLVVFPRSHADVVLIVECAVARDVLLIPFGGGTNVTGAVLCPAGEERMIVSVDTSQMNQVLWVDEMNLTARIQAGMIGQDLERTLGGMGYTTGHEPDSIEFSSVGGWVATRASGMKRGVYGNMEDLVVGMRAVTGRGEIERPCLAPRVSMGPDIHHMLLGSEGTLGIVTEVTMKIRPLPECRKYGSIVFPNFHQGVGCLREATRERCSPASLRLLDNDQFIFGQALKPEVGSFYTRLVESVKRFYITKWRGFSPDEMCVATLLFEGSKQDVVSQEKRLYELASGFGGVPAGEENGRRGYLLTFVIAYLRDMGLDYGVVSESLETSVPWDKLVTLTSNVKRRVVDECRRRGVPRAPYISCRVTQCYDAGACLYFYLAFTYRGLASPPDTYDEVEAAARAEILAQGGSLSHHHGVGKIRKRFLERAVTSNGLGALRSLKNYFDPHNIFGNGNLMCVEKSKL